MQNNNVQVDAVKSRKVQILLTIEYEGNTDENLANTMKEAIVASINVTNLLQGCDNIDAKVRDYSLKIDELPEDPVLIQEEPGSGGNDYILKADSSVWIQVDDQVVYIRRTQPQPGVAVDVMRAGEEDGLPLDSIYVDAEPAAAGTLELRPISSSGGVKSISDDDLCSGCNHCAYAPGEMSRCDLTWPGLEDEDGYVKACIHFNK